MRVGQNGKVRAGKPLEDTRLCPRDLVERIKRRYLYHKLINYLTRTGIMATLAQEFAIEPNKLSALLNYEGML